MRLWAWRFASPSQIVAKCPDIARASQRQRVIIFATPPKECFLQPGDFFLCLVMLLCAHDALSIGIPSSSIEWSFSISRGCLVS